MTGPASAQAGRREWVGLAVIALPCVVYAMDHRLRARSRAGLHVAADLMVGAAPPGRAGAAAGISETSSEFGGALGIAVRGAIGTAVYRGRLDDALPAGVPPEAAEAARDTLGAAVAAGDELAGEASLALVDAAREAFTDALRVAATLSATVAVGAAILAGMLLRSVPMGSELEDERSIEPRALAAGRPC
jgi:MFS transporter, DHA2 family, multidrug resistance protein